jgi:hypothetical protein
MHDDATTPVLASTLEHFLPEALDEEWASPKSKGFISCSTTT